MINGTCRAVPTVEVSFNPISVKCLCLPTAPTGQFFFNEPNSKKQPPQVERRSCCSSSPPEECPSSAASLLVRGMTCGQKSDLTALVPSLGSFKAEQNISLTICKIWKIALNCSRVQEKWQRQVDCSLSGVPCKFVWEKKQYGSMLPHCQFLPTREKFEA